MAVLLKADGTEKKVSPKNGKRFGFNEMKELLGMKERDLIQYVYGMNNKCRFVCDEEAKLKRQKMNKKASYMGVLSGAISTFDCFAGDILYFGEQDMKELPKD